MAFVDGCRQANSTVSPSSSSIGTSRFVMSIATWGAYIARRRRTHENVAERKDVARDAQRCSVSLGEAAESEPAEIVPDAIFEAGDDRHKAGRIDSRHGVVSSRSSASRIWKLLALNIASPGTVGRGAIVDGGF